MITILGIYSDYIPDKLYKEIASYTHIDMNEDVNSTRHKKYVKKCQKNIKDNHGKLWVPPEKIHYKTYDKESPDTNKDLNMSSKFSIMRYKSRKRTSFNTIPSTIGTEDIIKTKKVILDFSDEQKIIINKWMEHFRLMYNKTIKFIKENYHKTGKTITSFMEIRDVHLKDFISDMRDPNDKTKIKKQILVGAIRIACSNFKSALTNRSNGNITHFRIRNWRKNRPTRIMTVTEACIGKLKSNPGHICRSILGDTKCFYDGEPYKLVGIEHDCEMHYDSIKDVYTLIIPETVKQNDVQHPKNMISLDPGIRCFMTGISENEVIKIGEGINIPIEKELRRLDRIMGNANIPNRIKRKNEKRIHNKISNKVDDFHWKSIKFLTTTYRHVLIGNMSVTEIVSNKRTVIRKIVKRVAYKLKFYQFHQRLMFKCRQNKSHYNLIDESYTSKMCSKCGNIKDDLGGNKTYTCDNVGCGLVLDRDVNGCRGIYFKYILSHP